MSDKNQWKVSKVNQKKSRKQKFSVDRYWCVSYTEKYKDSSERDFKTVIKARSAELAKIILKDRLSEDKYFSSIVSPICSLIHSKWNIRAFCKPLTITQWAAIRAVAFPNDRNKVFKFEKKRREGQVNRFNTTQHNLSDKRKSELRVMAIDLSKQYIKNTFKPLCPELFTECSHPNYVKTHKCRKGYASLNNESHKSRELDFLRGLMEKCGGNIQYAADTIGVTRTVMYRALQRFKDDVDWRKEYPLTYTRPVPNSMSCPKARKKLSESLKRLGHKPPCVTKGTPQYKKWKKSMASTLKKKRDENNSKWKGKITQALRENNHHRINSAKSIGISVGYMNQLMTRFAKEDPEFYNEFRHPDVIKSLRIKSIAKTKADNQSNFIKENKHTIMQAYYQNDKSDNKACKLFKVCRKTFRAWREEIEKNA